jgi:hypothetical protein
LPGAWISLIEEVSFAQPFTGFFNISVSAHCEFQKRLLFVSIVLCILDMDELEMFNFLEYEVHIVGIVGISS